MIGIPLPGGEAQLPARKPATFPRPSEGPLHCRQWPPRACGWICPKTCRIRKRSSPISIPSPFPALCQSDQGGTQGQIKGCQAADRGEPPGRMRGWRRHQRQMRITLVTKLAELLNLPVTTTLMGLGAFRHPSAVHRHARRRTAPSKRTRACTTRISSSPWVPASMTA